MTTYYSTDYQESGAGDLMNYISREGDTPVYDRSGQEMSNQRKQRFIEKSEQHQFERHMIISPENGDQLSNDELARETRRTMEDFAKDRPSTTFAYTVHRDTEHLHAHVAMTGEKTDLYMDKQDIDAVRENANERMVENDRYKHRSQENDRDRQHEREQEQLLDDEQRHRNQEVENEEGLFR